MPDGTTMTPENSHNQFKIGEPTQPIGGEMDLTPQYGPDQGHQMRIGGEVKNLLDDDEVRRQAEAEGAYYANQSREEEFAKRDRLLNRLSNAKNVGDVAATLEILGDFQDWSKGEAVDRYTYGHYVKTALDGANAYRKTIKQLQDEGIVEGPRVRLDDGTVVESPAIGPDGYLVDDAKVSVRGYAMRVEEVRGAEPTPNKKGGSGWRMNVQERVYFGSDTERKAMTNAHEQLMRTLIVGKMIHEQTGYFDANRAALEELVKFFYMRQIGLTNEQIGWVFTAADIKKITPENPNNQEAGLRRSKTFRMFHLMGNCETKEKMETHLNDTYNLEKLLDKLTVDRILKLQQTLGDVYKDDDAKNMPDMVKAARFLIGKGLTYEKDQWKVAWLDKDQRDPSKVSTEAEKNERGLKTIKKEKDSRGYLTVFGNPYARGSRDIVAQLNNRIATVLGEPSQVMNDIKIADRLFWTWGEKDQLGTEVFATLPTGEEILRKFNELTTIKADPKKGIKDGYDQWREWADERLRYFVVPGEPVNSDLSKLFHTRLYRMKDILNDRPTGSPMTLDEFDRMAQSLMTLCRTEVKVGSDNINRSMKEQFLGHKNNDGLAAEPAKEMGEIGWEQVTVPSEIEDAMRSGGEGGPVTVDQVKTAKELQLDSSAANDGAMSYFWLMNFLTGDGNPMKRPWAMINDEAPDPKVFMKLTGFTSKNKFITIDWHDGANVWGEWRKVQIEAKKVNKSVDEYISENARAKWGRLRKSYWNGVRSYPDYPMWQDQQMKARNSGQSQVQVSALEVVEGTRNDPGLAVRTGFMELDDVQRPVKNAYKTTIG